MQKKGNMGFLVTFWGVRGSTTCSEPDYMVYGGNTACVELNLDGKIVIIDAGSGIRELGKKLIREKSAHAALLISHTHWDHISGFPFFAPIYSKHATLEIYASPRQEMDTRSIFEMQMSSPFFPMPIHSVPSSLIFKDFDQKDEFFLYDNTVKVVTAPLNHPNGATGFRIEYNGKSLAYISDTEHIAGVPDQNVLSLAENCDLMIYDALFTEEEYASHVGWGHSTWQEAVNIAKSAHVKQTALFHHFPDHNDEAMRLIENQAKKELSSVFAARERTTVSL